MDDRMIVVQLTHEAPSRMQGHSRNDADHLFYAATPRTRTQSTL